MDLSIVICTYRRYDALERAVAAVLADSTYNPANMELIVVDNTPKPERQSFKLTEQVHVVPCDEVGLSNARNQGISIAQGEIIAFIDDDAIVRDTWCAAALNAFRMLPGAEVCGGKTVPLYSSSSRPVWYYEELARYLSCIDWGSRTRPIAPGEWVVGANMAFRKRVFSVARFDPSLGRKGVASLLSNEELAMFDRIGRAKVYYVPEMCVEHMIPDDRLTLEWFRKRVFWQAVSDSLSDSIHESPIRAWRELFEIVSRMPAEIRGHRLFSYQPDTPEALKDQLRALYLHSILLASGNKAPPVAA